MVRGLNIKVVSVRTSYITIYFNTVWTLESPEGTFKNTRAWTFPKKLSKILHGHVDIEHPYL